MFKFSVGDVDSGSPIRMRLCRSDMMEIVGPSFLEGFTGDVSLGDAEEMHESLGKAIEEAKRRVAESAVMRSDRNRMAALGKQFGDWTAEARWIPAVTTYVATTRDKGFDFSFERLGPWHIGGSEARVIFNEAFERAMASY